MVYAGEKPEHLARVLSVEMRAELLFGQGSTDAVSQTSGLVAHSFLCSNELFHISYRSLSNGFIECLEGNDLVGLGAAFNHDSNAALNFFNQVADALGDTARLAAGKLALDPSPAAGLAVRRDSFGVGLLCHRFHALCLHA